MAWYAQKNYNQKVGNGPYTIAQIGCFLTAFCNLMQKFAINIDPSTLNNDFTARGVYLPAPEDGAGVRDDLGWNSITAVNGQVKVTAATDHGTQRTAGWPGTSNAIVKFYYQSISHPWLDAAKTRPNMTTHFCLVADQNAHTIVDSWDGVIKAPGPYGQPVAWATFDYIVPQPVTPPPVSAPVPLAPNTPVPPSPRAGSQYKFQKGDTFWTLAPRFKVTPAQLMEYNDITDTEAHNIPLGFTIYIPPSAPDAPATSGYSIELLPQPEVWHITKSPSATRWGFGNVKNWSDFESTGNTPVNSDVNIVAVATVIIGKQTAAYYMDQLAVGDYAKTGHVTNTIGYNWTDLAKGPYVPSTPPPAPIQPAPVPPTPPPAPATPTPSPSDLAAKSAAPSTSIDLTSPNLYKATYDSFPTPRVFEVIKTVICPECDGRRLDHTLAAGKSVSISGTFLKGSVLYGRPTGAVKAGFWFGVPMEALESQDKVFRTDKTLAEKQALHATLQLGERLVTVLASAKRTLNKIKKK